jgi:peroxiredoxin
MVMGASIPEGSYFQEFPNTPKAGDLKFVTSTGETVGLSDFHGKVVLLNFWRKDCQYCGMEKKLLNSMLQTFSPDKLVVLSVNFWDKPAWVREFGKKNGNEINIMSGRDNKQSVIENIVRGKPMGYYVLNDKNEAVYEVKGFPSTYVISKEGKVVASHLGLAQWNDQSVKTWLAGLVNEGMQANRVQQSTGIKAVSPVAAARRDPVQQIPDWLDGLLNGPTIQTGNY